MTARDRKLLLTLAPLVIFALYWLLLMNPALDRRAELEKPLAAAQSERDDAMDHTAELQSVRRHYRADYAELVRLSKAIPQTVAVSDLMRELNAAAKGTGIEFSNISLAGSASGPADAATGTDATAGGSAGLDEIPVELTFDGRFFDLADLFHSIQRFVTTADGRLQVRGRLIRIDSFAFDSATFPDITAHVGATIFAVPAAEGPTGGATPVGPRGAERGDGGLEPVNNFSPATATPVVP